MAQVSRVFRVLLSSPAYAITAIVTIAIGIGVTTATFALVNGTIFGSLGIPNLERVVNITRSENGVAELASGLTIDGLARLRERQPRLIDTIVGVGHVQTAIAINGAAFPALVETVDGPYFDLLGVKPVVGRALNSDCCNGSADDAVVVISDRLWRTRFNSSPDILGSTLRLWGKSFGVAGVAPPAFHGTAVPQIMTTDVWVPAAADPRQKKYGGQVFARLVEGQTFSAAQKELRALGTDIDPLDASQGLDLTDAWRGMLPAQLVTIGFLIAAAGIALCIIVLLIACANTVNLIWARSASRRREFALRIALGATKHELDKQARAESLAVVLPATALGAVIAVALLHYLQGAPLLPATGAFIPRVTATIDARVFAFVTLTMLGVTLMLTRGSVNAILADPATLIGGSTQAVGSALDKQSRARFVSWQLAAATAMLIVAALFVRDAHRGVGSDLAFPVEHAAIGELDFEMSNAAPADRQPFLSRLLATTMPRGSRIEIATALPVASGYSVVGVGAGYKLTGGARALAHIIGVSRGFLDTLGLPLVRGAGLSADATARQDEVVIDETLAHSLWPVQNPIGQQLWVSNVLPRKTPYLVVGVVRSPASASSPIDFRRFMFVAIETQPLNRVQMLIRGLDSDAALVSQLTHAVSIVDPEAAVIAPKPLRDYATSDTQAASSTLWSLSVIGLLAGIMALSGLYAVVSHNVTMRVVEFGIMKAIGAGSADIYVAVVGECTRAVVRGTAYGTAIAVIIALMLPMRMLFGISAMDVAAFTAVPVGALLVALAATLPAARRANRVNPIDAMRTL